MQVSPVPIPQKYPQTNSQRFGQPKVTWGGWATWWKDFRGTGLLMASCPSMARPVALGNVVMPTMTSSTGQPTEVDGMLASEVEKCPTKPSWEHKTLPWDVPNIVHRQNPTVHNLWWFSERSYLPKVRGCCQTTTTTTTKTKNDKQQTTTTTIVYTTTATTTIY